jgi:Tol biopolymer transport system component
VYTFGTGAATCHQQFREIARRITEYNLPAWSPDSAEIAFYENVFYELEESDMWTLNVTDGTFTNHTDDGYSDTLIEMPVGTAIDYTPAWHPDGTLYFLRSVKRSEEPLDYDLGLYRVVDGEAERVRDLTLDIPEPLPIWRPMAFSPDGTKLAFIALGRIPTEFRGAGIWTYEVTTDTLAIVAPFDAFTVGMPDWHESRSIQPNNVFWAGDDALVVSMNGYQMDAPGVINMFVINLATLSITPVVDLSGEPGPQEFYVQNGDESAPAFRAPLTGAVSPDGSVLWYITRADLFGAHGLWAYPLPAGSGEPVLLHTFEGNAPNEARPSVSADGRLMIYDWLFTFTEDGE